MGARAPRQSIASALQSQIATLDSSFLTDVWDWNLEVLTSNSTGSNTDWTINASVASNNPTLFPTPSFTATDTTMVDGTGARNGDGVLYGYVVPPGGYAPNGNLVAASDSASGDWAYFYDDLDRLTVAKAQSNVTAPSNYAGYFNCMKYDAYGNRLSEAMSTTLCGGTPPLDSWATYNPVNNQMKTSSMGTITYDFSGNVLSDGRNNYWYDAEGRVCASQVINGGSAYQYVYDAEGARIAIGTLSSVPKAPTNSCAAPFGSSFTTYSHELVDQSGDQVTEFDSGGNFTHTNVWIAGGLEATYDKTALHFNVEDPVGTKRAQANVLGQLDETCVSLPFGNDINDPYGVNCTAASNGLHTGDDDGEIHFSQKERDTETGNDYFLARYYNSAWGRFITPDWSVKVEPVPYAKLDDPQTLNLYAYVRNNPLSRTDPDGHCANHYKDGSCKVNVDPKTGEAGAKAGKQLEGVLNKYDKAINALGDKSKFDIKDSKGNVIGSLTGKEIKAVWNGTSFTVTNPNYANGGVGGGTGGTWKGDSFSGQSKLSPGAVSAYVNAASARNEDQSVGLNTLTFHELGHETHFGEALTQQYPVTPTLSWPRERGASSAGSTMSGTVNAPFDCSISGGCQ